MTGSYDYRLVALSVFLAVCASFAALDLAGRVTAARGWVRSVWLGGGAIVMGLGIWSMHFTGMLAFRLPVSVIYDWPTVFASLLASIFSSGIALYVVSRPKIGAFQVLTGGIIMGFGIAAMHYIGMAAMRMAATCTFNLLLVALSFLIAIAFSLAALWLAFYFLTNIAGEGWKKLASATQLGLAISVMHYSGMSSASFIPAPTPMNISHSVSISSLGTAAIAITTLTVLGFAVWTSTLDRRLAVQALELQCSECFRQIADNFQEVFVLSNADLSEFFYVNRAYRQIWGRTPESLYAHSMSFLDGVHPDDRERFKNALEGLIKGEPIKDLECRVVRPDGSTAWVACRGYPVCDARGRIHRLVGSAQDITERKHAEEALRRSEDRYRDLVEHSHDLICTHDLEGILLSVNEAPLRILGYSRDEFLNKPLRDFVTPEARPLCDAYLSQVQRDGFAKGLLPVLTKGGEVRLWEYNNSLRRDGAGPPVVRGLAHDVTEQKRAEAALRRSEEKFSKAFHSSPAAMAITSLAEGRFVDVNERFGINTGFGREELIGHTFLELGLWMNPASRAPFVEEVKKNGKVVNREIQIRTKSGEIRSELYSAELIEISGQQCLLAVSEDITERKRDEEKLQEYEKALEGVEEMIAVIDRNYRYLLANRAFIKYRSMEKKQVVGCLVPEVLDAEIFTKIVKTKLDEAFAGRAVKYELRYPHSEIGLRDIFVSYFPIEGSVGVDRVVCVLRDITDQKRTEEELRHLSRRLLQLQDEERRRIAQDLHDSTGQDLVAVSTTLGQLQASASSSSRKARKLISQCQTLVDGCIRDIRTLSYVFYPPMLDERGLEDAIRHYLEGFAERTGIGIEVEIAPCFGRLTQNSELALFRVMQESLTNILRHSGSFTAKIKLHRDPEKITLEVSDTGRGISACKQKQNGTGPLATGVGIPSMQERMKQFGGRLDIESSGQGTTVRVVIPTVG